MFHPNLSPVPTLLVSRYHNRTGMWDDDDDCCERMCTPQHPCKEGGGICLTDTDCKVFSFGKLKGVFVKK